MAPINFWPAMFVTFPLLVWLLDGAAAARWGGIAAGLRDRLVVRIRLFSRRDFHWVGNAFLVDAKTFAWLLPFAVTLLPAGLAVFTGLGVALARRAVDSGAVADHDARGGAFGGRVAARPRADRVSVEYVRLCADDAAARSLRAASIVRHLGPDVHRRGGVREPGDVLADSNVRMHGDRWGWPLMPAVVGRHLLLAALATFGGIRLARNPTEFKWSVRPVTDHAAQYTAGRAIQLRRQAADHESLRRSVGERGGGGPVANGLDDITLLIWPESAFPFFLTREPDALAMIADMLAPDDPADHRRREPGAEPVIPGRPSGLARLQFGLCDRSCNGTILAFTTSCIWCRSVNSFHFRMRWNASDCSNSPRCRAGLWLGKTPPQDRGSLVGAPDLLPLICYEIIFPGAKRCPKGRAAGLA